MKKALIISILSLLLFVIVLFNMGNLQLIDNSVNSLFSAHQNTLLIQTSKAASYLFQPEIVIVYALIISLMLLIKKHKRESILFAVSMLAGGLLMYVIKEIVQRARPVNALISESGFSFPSGHALISVVFLGFFIYLALKNIKSKTTKTLLTMFLTLAIIIVGLSRLILNVHWLSDVIGGWLLGLFILLGSVSIKQQ